MLGPLPVVWWGLVCLVCKLLRISNEIGVWLDLFPLSRSSSSLTLIHIKLHSLVSMATWSCWSRLNHLLFAFHLAWANIAMHVLLMLSRWASSPLIWALLLVLVLLQEQLLLFQYLDLISILHRCWPFCIRRWIGDNNDLFCASEIFFIISSLVLEVELLCLAEISFGCKWVVNHVHMWILAELLATWTTLMVSIWVAVWCLDILSTFWILFAAIVTIPVSWLSVRISWWWLLALSTLYSRLIYDSSACRILRQGSIFVIGIWARIAFMTWWVLYLLILLPRLVTALVWYHLLVLWLFTLSIRPICRRDCLLLSLHLLLLP